MGRVRSPHVRTVSRDRGLKGPPSVDTDRRQDSELCALDSEVWTAAAALPASVAAGSDAANAAAAAAAAVAADDDALLLLLLLLLMLRRRCGRGGSGGCGAVALGLAARVWVWHESSCLPWQRSACSNLFLFGVIEFGKEKRVRGRWLAVGLVRDLYSF